VSWTNVLPMSASHIASQSRDATVSGAPTIEEAQGGTPSEIRDLVRKRERLRIEHGYGI